MRYLLPLLAAAALHAQTLPALIDAALNNEKINSLNQKASAAALNHEAIRLSYLPRLDAFGNATVVDRSGGFDAKRAYATGVKAEVTLFDGFKRENTLNRSNALKNAALYDLSAGKKTLSLEVIQRYFELQNTLDEIKTNQSMIEQISAQLSRLEKFRSAGLASEDALMRMRSEYSNAQYLLEDLNYQSERQKGELHLITNVAIDDLKPAHVIKPSISQSDELDSLKALRYSRDAKQFEAQSSDAGFYPTFKIEDQYTFYDYHNDPIAAMRVDAQNKFIASLSMNLTDFSSTSAAKQALAIEAQAQNSELAYAAKEAKNNLIMAEKYIRRTHVLIESAQNAYDASRKTFDAVKQKYEARIVDYITYLDALHELTDTTNQFSRAKRSLDYAYAAYYYYAGEDPKEFVE